MKKKRIDKYLGEKCRILYKKPGESNIHINTGIISSINKNLGTIKIESHHKKIIMKINKILTIEPIHYKVINWLISFYLYDFGYKAKNIAKY